MLIETLSHVIGEFEANQTPEGLAKILEAGFEVRKLQDGEWVNTVLSVSFPINFVRLYDKVKKDIVLTGIGIY